MHITLGSAGYFRFVFEGQKMEYIKGVSEIIFSQNRFYTDKFH
jgi:hypothetical protein